jgi:hypothetical protein
MDTPWKRAWKLSPARCRSVAHRSISEKAALAVQRLHGTEGDGEPLRIGVPVRGDPVVDPAGVGQPVDPRVGVPDDDRGLAHPAGLHDPDPFAPFLLLGWRRSRDVAGEELADVADMVMAIEDVEGHRLFVACGP